MKNLRRFRAVPIAVLCLAASVLATDIEAPDLEGKTWEQVLPIVNSATYRNLRLKMVKRQSDKSLLEVSTNQIVSSDIVKCQYPAPNTTIDDHGQILLIVDTTHSSTTKMPKLKDKKYLTAVRDFQPKHPSNLITTWVWDPDNDQFWTPPLTSAYNDKMIKFQWPLENDPLPTSLAVGLIVHMVEPPEEPQGGGVLMDAFEVFVSARRPRREAFAFSA